MTTRTKRLLWLMSQKPKLRTFSGVPPLTFKAKKSGTLKNYRIYGNTVGGESVGDLVESGEHAGEYNIPVTVEGKNLAKNNHSDSSALFTVEEVNNFIHVSGTNNSGSTKVYIISKENEFPAGSYDIVNNSDTVIGYDYRDENNTLVYGTVGANSIKTFNFPAVITRYLNVYKGVPNGESIDNYLQVMIVKHGDDTDTYEPYRTPIAVPIYLPEPLKMVGGEAEFIDYAEQKQHRVRKNLLKITIGNMTMGRDNDDPVTYPGVTITINADKSITFNGRVRSTLYIPIGSIDDLKKGSYYLSGCPINGADNSYKLYVQNQSITSFDIGSGVRFNYISSLSTLSALIRLYGGYTCDNLTFYPMVRKASIEDDTYEPYIEDTEVDVILPGIAVTAGTNTLTVGTEVQPSNIEITGKIKGVTA